MATYTVKELRDLIKSLSLNDNGKVVLNIGKVGADEYQIMRVTDDGDTVITDPILDIASSNISGMSHINKFGRNPDCDKATSITAVNLGRSIWDGGIAGAVNWLEPTQARVHQLKSSSANDGAGTNVGARTVQVYGLDSSYVPFSELLTLNGVGNVATASYVMIYRMIVRSAGATGWNEGDLTVTADIDGTVTAKITAKNNQTLMAIYMIPADMMGYMPLYFASIHKTGGAAKLADVYLLSKALGEVWRMRDATDLSSDGAAYVPRLFKPYKIFKAKELIQIVANPSADAQDISAGFDIILVED